MPGGANNKDRGLALVTGASGSLGASIARHLAGMGYEVALHYHTHGDAAQAVCASIIATGGSAFILPADLTLEQDLDRLFKTLGRHKKKLEVLVNNAACLIEHPLFLLQRQQLQQLVELNQVAYYECLKRAARIMSRHGGGHIVNMGSLSARLPLPGQTAYAMSKAALEGLTKSAAFELGRFGIRVNSVIPAAVNGGMLPDQLKNDKKLHKRIPLGGLPCPCDIAACVGFLCCESSKFITGQSLVIDGGISLTTAFAFHSEP